LRVRMAARAKQTNARGEASPDAELLGAVVGGEVEPVDEPAWDDVFGPAEVIEDMEEEVLELDELVMEEELVLEEVLEEVLVDIELETLELVEEEAELVEDPVETALLVTPPINWNCGL